MPTPKVVKRTTTTVEEFLDVKTSAEDTELDGVEEEQDGDDREADDDEDEDQEEAAHRPAKKRRA